MKLGTWLQTHWMKYVVFQGILQGGFTVQQVSAYLTDYFPWAQRKAKTGRKYIKITHRCSVITDTGILM
jgi:hypothetical protein